MTYTLIRAEGEAHDETVAAAEAVCDALASTLHERQAKLVTAFNACVLLLDAVGDQMLAANARAGAEAANARTLLALAASLEQLADHFGQQALADVAAHVVEPGAVQ